MGSCTYGAISISPFLFSFGENMDQILEFLCNTDWCTSTYQNMNELKKYREVKPIGHDKTFNYYLVNWKSVKYGVALLYRTRITITKQEAEKILHMVIEG